MLRSADVRFFRTHGWLIVRQAVQARRVAELTRAFDRVLPGSSKTSGQVLNPRWRDRTLEAWALDRAIGELVAGLLGCRQVQLLQDVLLLKPPRTGTRVGWHQDYWRMHVAGLDAPRGVSVRLALTSEVLETGCLQVLNGSQDWGLIGRPILSQPVLSKRRMDSLRERIRAHSGGRAEETDRALELEAGDLSVHHCLTVHSSEKNGSPHPRKTIIMFAVDGDCMPGRPPAHVSTEAGGHRRTQDFPVMFERAATRHRASGETRVKARS